MKMIKNLSKVVVRNYPDFHLREDLNFSDDGNYFRGFDYKGLPITTLRTEGTTYLAVRVDYIEKDFTYADWFNTKEYRLADEFNGCDEVDLDKLIENCEKILAKVNELNEKANTEKLNMVPVADRLLQVEIDLVDNAIEGAKNINWWKMSDYELRSAKRYIESLQRTRDRIWNMKIGDLSVREKRDMLQRLEKYGYVVVEEDDIYIRELKELEEKYN